MRTKLPRWIIWYLLAPLWLVLCLEGFTRMDPFAALWWMIRYPLAMLFSFGLLAGLCALPALCGSTKSHNLWLLVCTIACSVYGIVNHYKLVFRMEPILLTDVTQIRDAIEVTALGFDINWALVAIVAAVFGGLAVWLCRRKGERV